MRHFNISFSKYKVKTSYYSKCIRWTMQYGYNNVEICIYFKIIKYLCFKLRLYTNIKQQVHVQYAFRVVRSCLLLKFKLYTVTCFVCVRTTCHVHNSSHARTRPMLCHVHNSSHARTMLARKHLHCYQKIFLYFRF